MYWIRWWLVGLFARIYTIALFRGVEVAGSPDHVGPRLIVANHFGGLVDAIVVVRALGGLPHIVAKSTLFERFPLRILLRLLGVVPVYRRADNVDMANNESSFHEVAAVLAKGRTVLIFPEGTVTDSQELQHVRTGAARMALAGIEAGADGLAIVPLGITYEDKVSARSRVLVEVGKPITEGEVDEMAAGSAIDETNRNLVVHITDAIADRLRAVAPGFGSLLRERTMMLAAGIHLRSGMTKSFAEPSMSRLRDVAQILGGVTRSDSDAALGATGRYELALSACGLEDHQVQPVPKASDLARLTLRKGVLLLLLTPFALAGLSANLIAILLVIAVGAFVKEPVTKGTARVVTGLVVFPASWIILIAVTHPSFVWLTILLLVVGLISLVVWISLLVDLLEALTGWWAVRNHVALLPDLALLRGRSETELSTLIAEAQSSP